MKTILAFAIILTLITIDGCVELELPEYNVSIDSLYTKECCGVCTSLYGKYLSVESPIGGKYYWLGLVDAEILIKYGDSVFVPEGYFNDLLLYIPVSCYDSIPERVYSYRLFASGSPEDVGNIEKQDFACDVGLLHYRIPQEDSCLQCCNYREDVRWYCQFMQNLYPLVGVRADIKTRFGNLCGVESHIALSAAWVGIKYPDPGVDRGLVWAQMGYTVARRQSCGPIDTIIYAEANGEGGYQFDFVTSDIAPSFPTESEVATYQCDLDLPSGVWTFTYNNSWDLVLGVESSWQNIPGEFVEWTGEIGNLYDDMPGIESNPCVFSECMYKQVDGSYKYASDSTSEVFWTTSPKEWGMQRISGSEFKMWDKCPLPESH